jgi:spore maturation protein CgeB
MREHLQALLADVAYASSIAARGLETIRSRHTCAHRVDELLAILAELGTQPAPGIAEAKRAEVSYESLQ